MISDDGLPAAFYGVVPQDSSFQLIDRSVVPVGSCFPPTAPDEADARPAGGVEDRVMRMRPLVAATGLQETDMSVFTDTRLMVGQDDTASTIVSQTPFLLRQLRFFQSRIGWAFRIGSQA